MEFATFVGLHLNANVQIVVGQKRLDHLGPLNEAGITAVDVVVVTNVVDFFQLLDAIEVEVVDRTAGERALLFVDNGEGGRSDSVGYLQLVAESLDEGGFT